LKALPKKNRWNSTSNQLFELLQVKFQVCSHNFACALFQQFKVAKSDFLLKITFNPLQTVLAIKHASHMTLKNSIVPIRNVLYWAVFLVALASTFGDLEEQWMHLLFEFADHDPYKLWSCLEPMTQPIFFVLKCVFDPFF